MENGHHHSGHTARDRPSPRDPQDRFSQWALACGLIAVGLATARWFSQETYSIYTDLDRVFYVPDAILGWRQTTQTWMWLGLDTVIALCLCVAGTWIAHKLAAKRPNRVFRVLRTIGRVACVLSPMTVVAVFLSGLPPSEARAFLPVEPSTFAPKTSKVGSEGAKPHQKKALFAAPAGRYVVASHASNLLVAKLNAGGEAFEGKFSPLSGFVAFDPAAPGKNDFQLKLQVPTGSIETGVPLRNDHAASDLKAKDHPMLVVEAETVDSVTSTSEASASFRLVGRLALMGKTLELPVDGTLRHLAASERTKLGLESTAAFLVNASLSVPITATSLDASSFDAATIPVTARFLIVPASDRGPSPPRPEEPQ